MTNPNYVTLETKSILARYTTTDSWIAQNNETRLIREAGFNKIDILDP
jgi:hypothetical protein